MAADKKPRYTVDHLAVLDGGRYVAHCSEFADAERIAAALNAQDERQAAQAEPKADVAALVAAARMSIETVRDLDALKYLCDAVEALAKENNHG